MKVIELPKGKREGVALDLVKKAGAIADKLPDMCGFAIVAWHIGQDATMTCGEYEAGGIPTHLVPDMMMDILNDHLRGFDK